MNFDFIRYFLVVKLESIFLRSLQKLYSFRDFVTLKIVLLSLLNQGLRLEDVCLNTVWSVIEDFLANETHKLV